jgi:glycosyltransferase involved in cell wall biosynthesis
MTNAPPVEIVLSTYNGGEFLEAQLESIFRQGYRELRVLVRDDGSSDGTASILQRYAAVERSRFHIVSDDAGNLGPCGSFSRLLGHCRADYVLLCDQDDVWLPERIEKLLSAMRRAEDECGHPTPILVHSDLTVVDRRLATIHPSFWAYRGLDPLRGATLRRLLVQNVVTGCATLVNRALLDVAIPIPPQAVIHDWWLALVAAAVGRLEVLREPTILYRQHGRNAIGASGADRGLWPLVRGFVRGGHLPAWCDRKALATGLTTMCEQAGAVLEACGPRVPASQRTVLEHFMRLADRGFLARRCSLCANGFFRAGAFGNLAWLLAGGWPVKKRGGRPQSVPATA